MSDELPSSSRQSKIKIKAGIDGGGFGASGKRAGGGRVKDYWHAVTNEQADLLTKKGNIRPLQEIKMKTGADVTLNSHSFVEGMKMVIIRGLDGQIEEAVKLINEKTGVQGTMLAQAQAFWVQWVKTAFPELDSRAYFLPPVYINRVPMTRQYAVGENVLVLHSTRGQAGKIRELITKFETLSTSHKTHEAQKIDIEKLNQPTEVSSAAVQSFISQPTLVQDSDVRDDEAFQRVLSCLQKMGEENSEVFVGMSQFKFGEYLNKPVYTAAAVQLPLPKKFANSSSKERQGDFDVLLIHRYYGFVVCEIKSFGDKVRQLKMSRQDRNKTIRKKLKEAVSQLDKAEAMLSYLASDINHGLRITKAIVFPNLTRRQVEKAISDCSVLTEDLCRCLGTSDPADIPGLCLCSDQLSDPKTPWDVSSHVLRELGHWWQRRVAGAGPDSQMTLEVYISLIARFCGPATTVSVSCISFPRLSVKTLGQAVWCTGECYTAVITLFPEQVDLLNTAPSRLFIAGPPGTGKTVVLLLMGIEWLRCGHHVYIVSTWYGSRAACTMLYHLLKKTVKLRLPPGLSAKQLHFIQLENDVEKTVKHLADASRGGWLYVISDEVDSEHSSHFEDFCEMLLRRVPFLHLWAGSCFHRHTPAGWKLQYLTRPLRSPPAVVREVEQDMCITTQQQNKILSVFPYTKRGVPDHTDGPPVRRLYHGGQGHSGDWPGDCVTCGREVASFLHSLRVCVSANDTATVTPTSCGTTPPCLQWRDVLVLAWRDVSDISGMVKGLEEAGIPVRVMKDDDIKDVATARSDVVWVTSGHRVRGLERKVVVCLEIYDADLRSIRLHYLSRCTSQLVIVSPYDK